MLTTRSLYFATAIIVASVAVTGCAKKKNNPEVRVPGGASSLSASGSGGTSGGPGAPWEAGNAPGAFGPGGGISSSLAGNGSSSDRDSMTGGFSQNANLDGLDSAMQIADLDMVHFPFDSFTISDEWQTVLDRHAEWLRSNPKVHVQVEGHTDERGTEEYNVTLGQRRADAVREYLVSAGVEDYRIATISYGKLRPLTFDQNEEAHFLNRRAMFLVYSPGTETANAW